MPRFANRSGETVASLGAEPEADDMCAKGRFCEGSGMCHLRGAPSSPFFRANLGETSTAPRLKLTLPLTV